MNRKTSTLALIVTISGLPAPASHAQTASGYGSPPGFDILAIVRSAPRPGDPAYEADRKTFRATRKLLNTPRWRLAETDASVVTANVMTDFSCALGFELSPQTAPRLAAFTRRLSVDIIRENDRVKHFYNKPSIVKLDPGPICETTLETHSPFDYPSGHAAWGWTWATLLAEMLPDRGGAILARGKAYGESRMVCGIHSASSIEAGRMSAAATLSVLRANSAYRADFQAVSAELAGLRQTARPADPQACRAQEDLVRQDVFALR